VVKRPPMVCTRATHSYHGAKPKHSCVGPDPRSGKPCPVTNHFLRWTPTTRGARWPQIPLFSPSHLQQSSTKYQGLTVDLHHEGVVSNGVYNHLGPSTKYDIRLF
jgi:hypothetical protein